MDKLIYLVPVMGLIGLLYTFVKFNWVSKQDAGTDRMKEISKYIADGAMAFLKAEWRILTYFGVIAALLLGIMGQANKAHGGHWAIALAFIIGAVFSALAGYIGMKVATRANVRTAHAARSSLSKALSVSFTGGAVMGLGVSGLAVLGLGGLFIILKQIFAPDSAVGSADMIRTIEVLTGFSLGAESIALFARVGGGIYTKAADVGADLVGKVEAGIPEDDPRNPATIADNVGDNVGDVAGMGADLFESFAASILASALLGAAAYINSPLQNNAVIAPMLIAAVGTILSILGVFLVRTKEGATQKQLLKSLGFGVNISAVLIVIASFFILKFLELPLGIWGSIIVGLVAGIIIGQSTEYFTASAYRPTQKIAESSSTGPATVIISGVGTGLISAAVPLAIVVVAITLAFGFATNFDFNMTSLNFGLYGIGIAAVGMLSTLGITLATDAYGPIADNAGGNAEMSSLGPEVRKRTDALDSLGNTTAATGKGFAIGSAALTALALLASYFEEIRMMFVKFLGRPDELINGVKATDAAFIDFVKHYEIHLMNPMVIVGIFIGVMAVFLFSGMTMNAVGRAAQKMVDEVRRQFKSIPGIMEGKAEPDYARCVEISTKGAQREMLTPSLLALLIPVIVGIVFGVPGIAGLLLGTISSGFALAIFMANAGGAWDNAKKYVEEGNFGGKGSEAHKATVIGDTVGDPFKDTSGPSLNILIKLMVMASVVTVGVAVSYHIF
ncbi:MAG TPA: sodium-translocating pyrophosphatase [Chitinophagaceae bacterium]|nr:sodium-translocating pyrophosphatase [Chitinophagaceae bacterium]